MTQDLVFVLLMLAAAVTMFAINRPRMDAVGLLAMVALPFTGIITMSESLAGFADPAIVLIAALFVIGEGLVRTGVARRLGDWLDRRSGKSEWRLLVMLMASVAALGSIMSSTAVVAIFIPVVLRICRNRDMSPRRLMMPLSFAALISGMLTLVATTPNLIINAELARQGLEGFGFFGITVFGLPILVLGIIYMLFARRLLGSAAYPSLGTARQPRLEDWIERYGLAARGRRLLIGPSSRLRGKRVDEIRQEIPGIHLLAIERRKGRSARLLRAIAATTIELGDILLIDTDANPEAFEDLLARHALEAGPQDSAKGYFGEDIGMIEAMLPVESALIGKTVQEAGLPDRFGLTAIGLRHGNQLVTGPISDERLKLGDTLLLVGFWSEIHDLHHDRGDLIALAMPADFDDVLPAPDRTPHALAILALVVALMVTGIVPNVQAALIGCLLMGLLGCVDFNSAYNSISWKTLVLIVGMLPFSLALERTGGVGLAAEAVVDLVGNGSIHLLLGGLFVITAVLGLFISNTATAILMAPVAIAIAKDLGASPYPFAMIVALAASTAFMTPVSSPVNTLVVGPGQYSFGDFLKVGVPFSIVAGAVSVILVPILLPL